MGIGPLGVPRAVPVDIGAYTGWVVPNVVAVGETWSEWVVLDCILSVDTVGWPPSLELCYLGSSIVVCGISHRL